MHESSRLYVDDGAIMPDWSVCLLWFSTGVPSNVRCRGMRPGEAEGKDYFFVTKEKFEEWKAQNMLLEHALVYGEYKGIPRQQVDSALAAGTDVVLRIDVQGAATVRQLLPDVISIFLTAESEDALVRRLVARKTEDQVRPHAQTLACIPLQACLHAGQEGGGARAAARAWWCASRRGLSGSQLAERAARPLGGR